MTKLAVEPNISVRLNQCLFGYDNGHRLLSTSLRLPDEAAALLLQHSDLVPGLNASQFDGYWTGIPLSGARLYALMRTWPAPEMPRPGCVWTHVILIGLADMARFPDLAVVNLLFARPSTLSDRASYSSPLTIDPAKAAPIKRSLSIQNGLSVLRALYTPGATGVAADQGEGTEEAVFAVWSQQWPRLRRAFSFRTAGPTSDPSGTVRFDLRIARGKLPLGTLTRTTSADDPADWEGVAANDLVASEPTQFRRFLWRYGSDLRRGREKYRFLAELFLTTRLPEFNADMLARTLDIVVEALPEPDDGKLLKEDFLSAGRGPYSLLPPSNPVDTLYYVIGHPELKALPSMPEAAFDAVLDLWPARATEILGVTETAANTNEAIFETLLKRLSTAAEPASFISLSRGFPTVCRRLVSENPGLLNSADLAALPENELLGLLTLLPDDKILAGKVLDHLLRIDNAEVAATFANRFRDLTEIRVFEALVSELEKSTSQVPRVWPDAIRQRDPELANHILNQITTTTGLGVLAGWLGLDVTSGLRAPTPVWAGTLRRAQDDVHGQARQRMLAYLLALALARPTPGCEPLLEAAFESIHADIWSSRLPYDAFDVLSRFLPNLYWWEQWDTCRRLRLAVVKAYANGGLDPQSFRRLTSDAALFERLEDAASETGSGRRFLRRVFG